MSFAWLVTESVAVAVAAIALSAGQSLDSPPRPVFTPGTSSSAIPLRGLWREIGSGRIIDIGENGFDLYHETSILCYGDEGVVDAPLDSRYAR